MNDVAAPWRVLVIDDDDVDRETVRRALRRAGLAVDVSEAATGAGALALLARERFDCVFLDYNLPGSDGVTLLAAIRRAGHEVPVIALTGHGDEEVAVELMKAGAADYVAKGGATAERLASSVRYATELARAQAQARAAEEELRASAARARFLAEASAILARSLDVRTTLARVARLAVPILGDYVLVILRNERETELAASAHREVARRDGARRLGERLAIEAAQGHGRLAGVLRHGQVAVLKDSADVNDDTLGAPDPDGDASAERDTGSALYVPLAARHVLGAIVFGRRVDRPTFATDEIALAEDLASRAAAAIENARLYHEADDARQRTDRLQQVTAKLAAVLSQHEVAEFVVAEAREALSADAAWLAVLSADRTHLNAIASFGYADEVLAPFACRRADEPTPARDTLRSGEARWFTSRRDLLASYPQLRDAVRGLEHDAHLILPVRSGGTIDGVMALGFRGERTFSPEDVALGTALAQQCAQALERARLYDAERAARTEAESARCEAEEANRAKSEFLARMSHDLRTPLNAIGGYAQLIEEGIYGEPTPGQRESLARIRRAQEHLLTLINDVLSFARLEAGQVRLSVEDVAVQSTLETLSTLIQPQAMAKAISINLETLPDALAVRADKERVTQILLNLLTNAIKFTESGGTVTLSADRVPGGIALRVSDTGRGIPADRIDAIFSPFVQGGQAGEERQGVGLGLAIGRELARMMAGELSVTSEPGRGSTFVLTLPSAERVLVTDAEAHTAAV